LNPLQKPPMPNSIVINTIRYGRLKKDAFYLPLTLLIFKVVNISDVDI